MESITWLPFFTIGIHRLGDVVAGLVEALAHIGEALIVGGIGVVADHRDAGG